MRSFITLFPVVVFFLSAPFGNVLAQEPEIRTITQTESTSKCIGDPRTPLCAVETLLACNIRGQIELCQMIGRDALDFVGKVHISQKKYFLFSKKTIREQDMSKDLEGAYWHRIGFVELDIKSRSYFEDGRLWPVKEWDTYSYMLKPVGNQWHVVSSVLVGFEDFAE